DHACGGAVDAPASPRKDRQPRLRARHPRAVREQRLCRFEGRGRWFHARRRGRTGAVRRDGERGRARLRGYADDGGLPTGAARATPRGDRRGTLRGSRRDRLSRLLPRLRRSKLRHRRVDRSGRRFPHLSEKGERVNETTLSPERLVDLYRLLVLIRRFEERASELRLAGFIPGFLHPSIGQEAVAVGVCAALGPNDAITSTHRGHGHMLARGADPRRMYAELYARRDGYNRAKGGSLHMIDTELGFLGANGIVGA